MTDKTAELLEAAKAVLPFLQASTDHRDYLRSIRTATLEEDKKALEKAWKGPLEGLVVTRYGYMVPTRHIEIIEAAHQSAADVANNAAEVMTALSAQLDAERSARPRRRSRP